MKKIICAFLSFILIFSLSACGYDDSGANNFGNYETNPDTDYDYNNDYSNEFSDTSDTIGNFNFDFLYDNYYSIVPRDGGNETILLKFSDISETSITIEYLSYDLGNYGKDEYDHDFLTETMTYNSEYGYYEFEFCGRWHIGQNYIEYSLYDIHSISNDGFHKKQPVNPEDYWWFEEAKRQTGNYETNNSKDLSTASVGDIISFGKFEMDNDTTNGPDKISWLVISETEDSILVLSKYCLSCQTASDTYDTWENSNTRTWLNGDFYNSAFSSEEKGKIKKTTVVNTDNPHTKTSGGNDTLDYLFLLSIDEVNTYLPNESDRVGYGTLYAQNSVNENTDRFDWWLRTPGKIYKNVYYESTYQCYVSGSYINTDGASLNVYNIGIRPAMWISKK